MTGNCLVSFFCFFLGALTSNLSAQTGPPATDIYLLDLTIQDGGFQLGKPANVTNRDGYDNQPSFLPDGTAILYTSIREDGQADIYRYNLADQSTAQVTQTPESEYSPTAMPDDEYFSVVRVEADSSQRLWKFPLEGGEPILVLPDIEPVGYHAWAGADRVALFVLGDPNSLYLANVRTGTSQRIVGSIGRSLHRIPQSRAISFVHKASETDWWIKRLDLDGHELSPLAPTLKGSEDYAWMPNGNMVMAEGSVVYKYHFGRDKAWVAAADLGASGLQNISRIAVNPAGDKLAVVSSR